MKGTIIKLYSFSATIVLLSLNIKNTSAAILKVGKGQVYKHIKEAVTQSKNGDTIIVFNGLYKEGNIIIDKSIYLLGEGFPVLDGEIRYEIFSVKSSNVTIKGFQLQNSGRTVMEDPGAIKVYECSNILIEGNIFINNYFGVYLQYTQNCIIKNNVIKASQKEEYQSGNGIHCWKSDSLQITGNRISGHRDGIYFEFVTHSVIWRNVSKKQPSLRVAFYVFQR